MNFVFQLPDELMGRHLELDDPMDTSLVIRDLSEFAANVNFDTNACLSKLKVSLMQSLIFSNGFHYILLIYKENLIISMLLHVLVNFAILRLPQEMVV